MSMLNSPISRALTVLTSAVAALMLLAGTAHATKRFDRVASNKVVITINKSTQRMTVRVGGVQRYTFRVSTGKRGHATPRGTFRPTRLAKMHYSRKYNMAKMPNSVFFTNRGHAIHGTNAVRRLGRPASHGCVRLAPGNAAALFALVKRYGARNVTIRVI
ncbi:MAG TPA: L,D-transpeptidase [Alphaproteobacteria bacterium]|nr:L,D-transpeptidase [Alphaproteobacteria bacterium]